MLITQLSDVAKSDCGDGKSIGAMNLTTPFKPMKLFKSLAAAAAVIAASSFFSGAAQAVTTPWTDCAFLRPNQ